MLLSLAGKVGGHVLRWPLDSAFQRIGRSTTNAIRVPDDTVSKEHAEILRRGGHFYLRDLGSRNGTRVNGSRAREPVELHPGDRIEIGEVLLNVVEEEEEKLQFAGAAESYRTTSLRADEILEQPTETAATPTEVLRLIVDAGRLLVLPRPPREICEAILVFVERAVPASRYLLLLMSGPDEEPVQVAARSHGLPVGEPLAISRTILKTVVRDRSSVLTQDASTDSRFGTASLRAQAIHSAMAVPLIDEDRVLGVLYVDSNDPSIHFTEYQLGLLTLLGNMAAVKITNARLLEAEQRQFRIVHELATAAQIQRGMLPAAPPAIRGLAIEPFLETCYEVGGDLYDFHVQPDGKVLMLVGDVSGKGIAASLLMSSFLSSARALYDACPNLVELAGRLHRAVYRITSPGHYVTGVLACLDPDTGVCRYVNAGHPWPMLVHQGKVRELKSTGQPFGAIEPEQSYEEDTIELRAGELLAIFSDGIPEARRGSELFEERQLRKLLIEEAAVPALPELRSRIIGRVRQFVGDGPRTDDLTLILARRENRE